MPSRYTISITSNHCPNISNFIAPRFNTHAVNIAILQLLVYWLQNLYPTRELMFPSLNIIVRFYLHKQLTACLDPSRTTWRFLLVQMHQSVCKEDSPGHDICKEPLDGLVVHLNWQLVSAIVPHHPQRRDFFGRCSQMFTWEMPVMEKPLEPADPRESTKDAKSCRSISTLNSSGNTGVTTVPG